MTARLRSALAYAGFLLSFTVLLDLALGSFAAARDPCVSDGPSVLPPRPPSRPPRDDVLGRARLHAAHRFPRLPRRGARRPAARERPAHRADRRLDDRGRRGRVRAHRGGPPRGARPGTRNRGAERGRRELQPEALRAAYALARRARRARALAPRRLRRRLGRPRRDPLRVFRPARRAGLARRLARALARSLQLAQRLDPVRARIENRFRRDAEIDRWLAHGRRLSARSAATSRRDAGSGPTTRPPGRAGSASAASRSPGSTWRPSRRSAASARSS